MPLIPAELLAQIKRDKLCVDVLEAAGHQFQAHGKDLVCRCPWHNDKTPSLVVSPKKNVWNCLGACGEGGDVIKLVMKLDGVSFRDAVEKLHGGPLPTTAKPSCPLAVCGSDAALAGDVIDWYHRRLTPESPAWAFLEKRGLARRDVIDHFRLGVSDRSLGQLLPSKQVKAGKALREQLEKLGLFRKNSGHEHFNGSLVVPVFDERGEVSEIYGRKITRNLRKGTPDHLYLPGPHRGVWNRAGLAAGGGVVVLCEALLLQNPKRSLQQRHNIIVS
jgi:DNA primase